MDLLDHFDDFTILGNKSFKIKYGNIIVSICCHNPIISLFDMRKNGVIGKEIENKNIFDPMDIQCFTFDGAEICIFNSKTKENLNSIIISPYADDYEESVDPYSLIDILIKVRDYVNSNENKEVSSDLQ